MSASEDLTLLQKELDEKTQSRATIEKLVTELQQRIESQRREKEETHNREMKLKNDHAYYAKQVETIQGTERLAKMAEAEVTKKRKLLEENHGRLTKQLKTEIDTKTQYQMKLQDIEKKLGIEKQAVQQWTQQYDTVKKERIEIEERCESERILRVDLENRYPNYFTNRITTIHFLQSRKCTSI